MASRREAEKTSWQTADTLTAVAQEFALRAEELRAYANVMRELGCDRIEVSNDPSRRTAMIRLLSYCRACDDAIQRWKEEHRFKLVDRSD